MAASQEQLVLVGTPSDPATEAHWAAVLHWADQHGMETTRRVDGGQIRCAIVTEEVLDGMCSPAEAAALHALHTAGIRCVNVHEAPGLLASAPSPEPA